MQPHRVSGTGAPPQRHPTAEETRCSSHAAPVWDKTRAEAEWAQLAQHG
jgi:hypothetical protein